MAAAGTVVTHVVAADTSVGQLAVLQALCSQPDYVARQEVVHVGRGTLRAAGLPQVAHVRAPFDLAWLGARALGRRLAGRHGGRPLPSSGVIVHAWSATALAWSAALPGPVRALVVQVESGDDLRRAARLFISREGGQRRWTWRSTATGLEGCRGVLVCPTALARHRLLEHGVPAEKCVLIREFVDAGELDRARDSNVRERLKLAPDHTILVALPPVSRRSGTFTATWAAMLLEKARPEVRLVIPAGNPSLSGAKEDEHRRVRQLVRASRHEHMVRFAARDFSLAELSTVADLAAYLPAGAAPVTGLAWAMAGGRAIVATAVPAVTEFLADSSSAWLCQPDSPKHTAQRMLQALQQPEKSRRLAQAARAAALEMFDRQRMIAQYARLYADLAEAGQTAR